jgi:DinB superfamily
VPGRHTDLSEFGVEVSAAREAVRIVQGLLVHDLVARDLYGVELSAAQASAVHERDARASLELARTISPQPLDQPRPPDERLGGRCTTSTLLTVALLRAAGIGLGRRASTLDGLGGRDHADRTMRPAVVEPSVESLRRNGETAAMSNQDIHEAVLEFESDELDARHPLRPKMRPTDADGFREAWTLVVQLWEDTVARARTLPPELLHESVNGEWSFIETQRHLLFATDSWIGRVLLGDPNPWHALDLPFAEIAEDAEVPNDRTARPSLDEVLALRAERIELVRTVVVNLTDVSMNACTTPVDAPGWPDGLSCAAYDCLLCVLNEEWQHRLYAERDLDLLMPRQTETTSE